MVNAQTAAVMADMRTKACAFRKKGSGIYLLKGFKRVHISASGGLVYLAKLG